MVRVRHYVTLHCLKDPSRASWMDTWTRGTDENFINTTSLSRSAFCMLLERFAPFYDIPMWRLKGGRPRKRQLHHHVLWVLLAFYVGSMQRTSLCKEFGIPPSTLARVLNAAEVALSNALHGFEHARIVWPSLDRQKALSRLAARRHHLMQLSWGFSDGKNYKVQQPSNPDVQNAHYNGWLHSVYVTRTLCFSADGLVVWAKHNCPGSWNDGETSLDFRRILADPALNPDPRYGIVADSAFPCGNEMTGRVMSPLKDDDLSRVVPSVRRAAKIMSGAITFVRQLAEWGMGSVEKVYHRLLLPLPYDVNKRKMRLDNLFRLSNFRVRTVSISQIRTTHFHGHEDIL
ncbi:hypothetical protein PF004_g12173 [Phytophthora fragariae]|uniref:DDE Tnp4 domain-containing protein n=1 Tax=Phytophthora fragariae TaxID=53985 RepID=A0A6G0NVX5_9STRA|nr:hypothetical protein PF004_g12173 [Phytophthora fragariae]